MNDAGQKVIWLVNKHAAPLKYYASHTRTVKLAEQFKRNGYEVYIVSASVVHNRNIDLIEDGSDYVIKQWNGVDFIHIKTRPYKGNGLSRILSFYEFVYKLRKYANQLPRPDVIIHSTNIPFDVGVRHIAKRLEAKYIVEVLDMWPENFAAYGMLKRDGLPMKILYYMEKLHYKRASKIVYSLEGWSQYVEEHGWDKSHGGVINLSKTHYINNGVDLAEFNRDRAMYSIDDEDLNNPELFKFVYVGSIRMVNQLQLLIDAAEQLMDEKQAVFLIYGDGPDRQPLEQYCQDHNITNVKFKQKWIEPQYVPYVMCMANVNIMNYAQKERGYGYSQNKLFQSLAAGRPICCNRGANWSPITKYKAGIDRDFGDAKIYAEQLKSFMLLSKEEYDEMCANALVAAADFDYAKLTEQYLRLI